jgi:N-sulfoglucosamine sulfohydrolase
MNIVYLHAHDVGRHLSPYGYAVRTPNIQRLAERGVTFRQAFAAAPTCSPSRAALLTGKAPHSVGMLGLAHRGFRLEHPHEHVAARLQRAGYRTILAGFQHVTSGNPRDLGYEETPENRENDIESVARRAVSWLERVGSQPDGIPFFLDAGSLEAHRPFHAPHPAKARWVHPPVPIPDTVDTRLDTAAFYASIEGFDRGVGSILDTLDRLGLAGSTMVILTTDHGPAFPGMKSTLTDHGLGVALILAGPGEFSGGRVVDALVSHLDMLPTICAIARIEPADDLQGRGLGALLRGETDAVRDAVFGEVTYHAAYEPMRSIRTERWTYIRRFDDRDHRILPNVDESPSRDQWLAHDWASMPVERESLYDNQFDPAQARNLATHPDYAAVRHDLATRLEHWMAHTNDSLLAGDVPLPPGGYADDPDALSPDQRPST